ncbi:MAG: GH92 family glycosyl hydrolase [Prevotella sp.]|nr:GH92 family glycosyl hydrolase [Prevotella sp.]
MSMKRILSYIYMFCVCTLVHAQNFQYVDPRIGSEGLGRVFPGPSMPFGMVKPGPDCTVKPNAGWAPMPEIVTGFSQTHVSGTGGGQKYGNVLVQPFIGNDEVSDFEQKRVSEDISLGYYTTTFENGIKTEITTAERCAFYRIRYPLSNKKPSLFIDASHYLGKSNIPDLREAQQFVGAEVEVINDHEVRGFTRIRGGWNNGSAYTVYFCLQTDKPFQSIVKEDYQKAVLHFGDTLVNVKIGISFISSLQAKRNIPETNFDTQLSLLRQSWEKILSRIHIEGTEEQKRMFYTGIYHTCLMPVNRTGENPSWTGTPYYDDYYAIWDTYRTSTPLITLLDEQREVDIVNSLLNIYKREGYMPDARSGNCNGRTQGGSNAEVVIADAFVKGLQGIDYELALEAMLKDADVDPGADHEKHGRGGLTEYNTLGYIPYGIDRAGNRTVEYAYDDYCIALVAKGLGREDLYERFIKQSDNWRNLWRSDYEWDGVKGYIMPKDKNGVWLDSVPWGHSKVFHPRIPYTPITKVAPWYLPWWSTFFYEALSAEYSLSIPHDVPGLIEACGGEEAFMRRLNLFFERKRYNVANEPSFLTPCLYHWLGRPDLTSDRVRQIITDNYNDSPTGLPGNDDSGAMSSWLVFHMMGLYPNAGQDYYLLHAPLLKAYTMQLCNGNIIHATVKGKGTHYEKVTFNGKELKDARISHQQLMTGGELVFYRKASPPAPPREGGEMKDEEAKMKNSSFSTLQPSFNISYTLNRQFRTWPISYEWKNDTLALTCKEATYKMTRETVEHATGFCWDIPADGAIYQPVGTFAFISKDAFKELFFTEEFTYDGITWRQIDTDGKTIHVRADIDRTEMWISTGYPLPFVVRMKGNPLGIDWTLTPVPKLD